MTSCAAELRRVHRADGGAPGVLLGEGALPADGLHPRPAQRHAGGRQQRRRFADSVALSGTAAGSATLKVTPATFDFGSLNVARCRRSRSSSSRTSARAPCRSRPPVGGPTPAVPDDQRRCTGGAGARGDVLRPRPFAPATAGGKTAQLHCATARHPCRRDPQRHRRRGAGRSDHAGGVLLRRRGRSGQQSANQKWTVKNTGGTAIHVDAVDLQGGDAAQFQRNASDLRRRRPRARRVCTVKVRFRPAGAPGRAPRSSSSRATSPAPRAADLSGTAAEV